MWKIHHKQIISNHVRRKQPWNSIAFQSYMFDYGYPLTLKHGWKRPGSFMFFSDAHGQLMSCQLDGPVETHCESKGTVVRSCFFRSVVDGSEMRTYFRRTSCGCWVWANLVYHPKRTLFGYWIQYHVMGNLVSPDGGVRQSPHGN